MTMDPPGFSRASVLSSMGGTRQSRPTSLCVLLLALLSIEPHSRQKIEIDAAGSAGSLPKVAFRVDFDHWLLNAACMAKIINRPATVGPRILAIIVDDSVTAD
jgi:hypothetical protein